MRCVCVCVCVCVSMCVFIYVCVYICVCLYMCVSQESVYGPSYEDIPRRVPDVRLMKEILQVDAKVPLEEGLRQTLEWYRNGHRK